MNAAVVVRRARQGGQEQGRFKIVHVIKACKACVIVMNATPEMTNKKIIKDNYVLCFVKCEK